jgi:hypothetical protein
MTFKDYIATARRTPNARGDFIMDARDDKGFPDPKSWDELQGYLRRKMACQGAIDGARQAWRGYRRAVRNAALAPQKQAD